MTLELTIYIERKVVSVSPPQSSLESPKGGGLAWWVGEDEAPVHVGVMCEEDSQQTSTFPLVHPYDPRQPENLQRRDNWRSQIHEKFSTKVSVPGLETASVLSLNADRRMGNNSVVEAMGNNTGYGSNDC